jgi:hypothetical protein
MEVETPAGALEIERADGGIIARRDSAIPRHRPRPRLNISGRAGINIYKIAPADVPANFSYNAATRIPRATPATAAREQCGARGRLRRRGERAPALHVFY